MTASTDEAMLYGRYRRERVRILPIRGAQYRAPDGHDPPPPAEECYHFIEFIDGHRDIVPKHDVSPE